MNPGLINRYLLITLLLSFRKFTFNEGGFPLSSSQAHARLPPRPVCSVPSSREKAFLGTVDQQYAWAVQLFCTAFKAALKGLSRICIHTGSFERTLKNTDQDWPPQGLRMRSESLLWARHPIQDRIRTWPAGQWLQEPGFTGTKRRLESIFLSMELEIRSEHRTFYMLNINWWHFHCHNTLNIC